MGSARSGKKVSAAKKVSPLVVRLDAESNRCLTEAAGLRHISVSDYVRTVILPQAKREIQAAAEQVVALTPDEPLAFWNALNETPVLTTAQRGLGAVMRGEA